MLLDGFHGFVLARIAAALVPFAIRGVFVRRLLPDVRYRQIVAPTLIPILVAAAAPLALRAILWGRHRTLGQAIAELVLFVATYTAMALWRERDLVGELLGAVRGGAGGPPGPAPGSIPVGDDDVLETAALEARPGPVGERVQ